MKYRIQENKYCCGSVFQPQQESGDGSCWVNLTKGPFFKLEQAKQVIEEVINPPIPNHEIIYHDYP